VIGSPARTPSSRLGALRAGIATLDHRYLVWAGAWTIVSLLGLGLVAAIIPNPIFGRMIAVEPFAVVTWLLSAPLLGLLVATWTAPALKRDALAALRPDPTGPDPERAEGARPGRSAGSASSSRSAARSATRSRWCSWEPAVR
jgi:hypothetical protein